MQKSIYLDYSATTPVDEKVFTAMQPYFLERFGNSASQLHPYGWEAESAVEKARKQIASALEILPKEIYFTSGATESNNWAIQGLIEAWQEEAPQASIHIISSNAEHNSILRVLEYAQKNRHVEVDFLPVGTDGRVSTEQVLQAIKPHTKLISLMWANNELGSLNPIQEISKITREKKIYFHTDATQAIGKIPLSLKETPVDLLSFSAHKLYGPKGVGALYLRSQNPTVQIRPLLYGGGQERGLRSGTLNVPGIVGFGQAMDLVKNQIVEEFKKALQLRQTLLKIWTEAEIRFRVNGAINHSVPQILNITFLEPEGSFQLPGISFSKGSACHSEKQELSHVLRAIGLHSLEAEKTLRFSFGRMTTTEELKTLSEMLFSRFKKIK